MTLNYFKSQTQSPAMQSDRPLLFLMCSSFYAPLAFDKAKTDNAICWEFLYF